MNAFGGALLLFTAGYLVFLCISAFRLMHIAMAAKIPLELLSAVVAARRHYGLHTVASFIAAALLAGLKGVLLLTGHYSNPGVLARLAVGDANDGIVATLGLVPCFLVGIAIAEALFFVRYDAYLRMIYALRSLLKLNLHLEPDRQEKPSSTGPPVPHKR
jgi:hypothetical protein